jgi:hypothetical protein
MMAYSYATQRKIRIIEERLGPNWADRFPGKSIDAIYNELVGDDRKNLFCKIDSDIKDRLDTMTQFHKTGMADFIEVLIQAEWLRFSERTADTERQLLDEFSGS